MESKQNWYQNYGNLSYKTSYDGSNASQETLLWAPCTFNSSRLPKWGRFALPLKRPKANLYKYFSRSDDCCWIRKGISSAALRFSLSLSFYRSPLLLPASLPPWGSPWVPCCLLQPQHSARRKSMTAMDVQERKIIQLIFFTVLSRNFLSQLFCDLSTKW